MKRFTVVDTRSNQVKTFNSEATTVGELKADLRREGIDPTGMDIQEGLTKTVLGVDSSMLPTNVSYRGTTTNNLVFRLTQPNKKIKSGSYCMSELYKNLKNIETALEGMLKEEQNLRPEPNCKSDAITDCLATLVSILCKEGVITAHQANSVIKPLIGVDLFDDRDDGDFEYDLEDIFGDEN